MKQLLLGCGSTKNKRLWLEEDPPGPEWDGELTTLDIEATHKPDVIWDLNKDFLPFETNSFDQIHAYEILEHIGKQGDWINFFKEWEEYWRIMKPGGYLFATVPHWMSMGAWGDPSHTRIINPMTLTFLSQRAYKEDVGRTVMSDFRSHYKGDWEPQWHDLGVDTFSFVLKAVK